MPLPFTKIPKKRKSRKSLISKATTATASKAEEKDKDVEKGTTDEPPPPPPPPKAPPKPSAAAGKRKSKVIVDLESQAKKSVDPTPTPTTASVVPPEKKDEEALEYDPEDDVWALDEGKASVGRKYAKSLMTAFRPVLIFFKILGLFPLTPVRNDSDGTYTVKFSWCSYSAISFLLFSTVTVLITVWMLISVMLMAVNIPEHKERKVKTGEMIEVGRSEEIFVYKRNIVAIIMILCHSCHTSGSVIAIFLRKDYIAKQLVYWTEVVELLQLDVGKNVARRLWKHLIFIGGFMVTIIILYILGYSPFLAGSGSTLYMFLARVMDPDCHWHEWMHVRKGLCFFYLMYLILADYIYILWFFYNCRILTNILRIWNNRFQYCLHKQILEFTSIQQSKDAKQGAKTANRTSRANLFQDHLVIFNLIEGVNTQFQVIMESFYLTTMIMIVFEAYGFVHAAFYPEYVDCGRQFDLIPFSLFLAIQLYIYLVITLEAAGVADEARHVLDIVRRKGMMTSRMDNELWFMLSMRLSFGGHEDVGIIGAGFFYVTKSFLLGAMSAMTSHLIIYYQFEIPYAQTDAADENLKYVDESKLIWNLEGISHHSTCFK